MDDRTRPPSDGRHARRARLLAVACSVAVALVAIAVAIVALAVPAAAHGGGLSLNNEPVSVPSWLFLLTGGGVVAASFLLTSFVTARDIVEGFHQRAVGLPSTDAVLDAGGLAARVVGVVGLAAVLVVGVLGPPEPVRNLAVLGVWVGWWAGFAMSAYTIGNAWPAVSPFRTLAGLLPAEPRVDLPERWGAWPAVAGLLGLVWLEVVSDLSGSPRLLAAVVAGYTVVTLVGVAAVGPEWFDRVDPVTRVFRFYGRVAPIQRTEEGLSLAWPGAALVAGDLVDGDDDVGFVVALLWVTSFDGLVSTPAWVAAATPVVEAGLPPRLVYLLALGGGFALFYGVYRLAARVSRRTARTYLAPGIIAARFAPALLPIAAAYHLAHYLPYFLRLAPALGAVAVAPLSPPATPPALDLPGWVGLVGPTAVLLGHVLAVWVAHSTAFDLFTGRLQPIRSQYPYVFVMVAYTMTSLWLLAQPYATPGFL